jgi:hypothetical protein
VTWKYSAMSAGICQYGSRGQMMSVRVSASDTSLHDRARERDDLAAVLLAHADGDVFVVTFHAGEAPLHHAMGESLRQQNAAVRGVACDERGVAVTGPERVAARTDRRDGPHKRHPGQHRGRDRRGRAQHRPVGRKGQNDRGEDQQQLGEEGDPRNAPLEPQTSHSARCQSIAASRRRCSSTSKLASGHDSPSSWSASSSSIVIAQLRYHLRSAGTTYHGATSVEVSSIASA